MVGNILSGFGCLLIFVGLILAFGVFPAIKNEDVRKFINIWDAETHNRAEFVSLINARVSSWYVVWKKIVKEDVRRVISPESNLLVSGIFLCLYCTLYPIKDYIIVCMTHFTIRFGLH